MMGIELNTLNKKGNNKISYLPGASPSLFSFALLTAYLKSADVKGAWRVSSWAASLSGAMRGFLRMKCFQFLNMVLCFQDSF